jgi:predicted DCC family thiol-disulfide oxidoreductase YuxK
MSLSYLLFDGHCRLCTQGSRRLVRLARPGTIELLDFQEPGVLQRFPGLRHEDCMREIKLVDAAGRVSGGAEAVARVIATRGLLGAWAHLYYVPGLRQLLDFLYAWVARNRYRFMGRTECTSDACALHLGSRGTERQGTEQPGRNN